MEKGEPVLAEFSVERGDELQKFKMVDWKFSTSKAYRAPPWGNCEDDVQILIDRAVQLARPSAFLRMSGTPLKPAALRDL